jgi:hypothetical protein
MKLVWHIFKKDLRRLWLPLLLWGAVIVLQYFAWRTSRFGERLHFDLWGGKAIVILWVLHLLAAWLLVPQLIHDDPLLGDAAGWRTRPISGARLLAAKLLGMALLLCLWPSLLTALWWIDCGFGFGETLRAVAVNALGMAAFTGVALLLAVLTDSLARYLAWSLVVVIALGLGALLLAAGMPLRVGGGGASNGSIRSTRALLASGVVGLAVVLLVPLQFLRRNTGLARTLAGVAALVAILIVQGWPWSNAQLLAKTGLARFALPATNVGLVESTVFMPGNEVREKTGVRVSTGIKLSGLNPGEVTIWIGAEPRWQIGDTRWTQLPMDARNWADMGDTARALQRGTPWKRDGVATVAMPMELPGQLAQKLRNGEGVLRARHWGSLWRAELGASVTLSLTKETGAASGLRQVHVHPLSGGKWGGSYQGNSLWWMETEPLFDPLVALELMNPDGMGGRRFCSALFTNGAESRFDIWPPIQNREGYSYFPVGKTPVGVLGLTMRGSSFDRERWVKNEADEWTNMAEAIRDGAQLTLVNFQEIAPLRAELPDTAFVPDLVFEGKLDDALRRAKAEGKAVFVRVRNQKGDTPRVSLKGALTPEGWTQLLSRFVCAEIRWEDAATLRRPDDQSADSMMVILKSNGEVQDRLRSLDGNALRKALEANAAGQTYAAALSEALAAKGGTDRALRFQLHEALRARGELAGAFDAVLWMFDHPPAPFEGSAEIFEVGWRVQRFVESYGPARAILLERRELAVANLRQDPRNEGAARMLFSITLGLQHDTATWREFPRLIPHENPLWWEFIRNWVNRTLSSKNYAETVAAVDLEKFFAEGPAWVRTQLLKKRALAPGGRPAAVAVWQRQLVHTGYNCVDALAATGQRDAALRVALAVLRVDSSEDVARVLYNTLTAHGAKEQANRLPKASSYGTR